jgi:hypothetical protein
MGLFQIGGHFARDAGGREQFANPVSARLRRPAIFTHDDGTVGHVPNAPRRAPVQADETKAAEGFFSANHRSHSGFIAESILQRQRSRFGSDERGEKLWQDVVGGCFEANQHEIGWADFSGRASAFGLDVKIPRRALDPDAAFADSVKIGAQQEMHMAPGPAEQGAVITSQCAATDNGNFHS